MEFKKYHVIILVILCIGCFFILRNFFTKKIIIAIIDTGIDYTQIKFRLSTVKGYNVLNPDSIPQDDNGHGTQIASIINFLESHIKILPIKAIEKSGVASKQALSQAIIVAVDRGVKIINISAGVISTSHELEDAINYAEKKNVIIVASAGNNGINIEYPAAYQNVLAIGGVDHNGKVIDNSNIGSELDFVALGEYKTMGLGEKCISESGTSLSVPIISVYISRLLFDNPNLTVEEIRKILLDSAIDIEFPGRDDLSGYGLIKLDEEIKDMCK